MKLKEQILKLRKKGFSYRIIAEKLNCSKSTIAYYCNSSTKSKIIKRNKALRRTVAGILYGKIGNFFHSVDRALPYKLKKEKKKKQTNQHSPQQRKVQMYKSRANDGIRRNRCKKNFGVKDFLNKVGEDPKCYLTGRNVDLSKKEEYHLDHIHPVSKGGSNELSNLGLACRDANVAKADMSTGEFVDLCAEVLRHHGFKVTPPK